LQRIKPPDDLFCEDDRPVIDEEVLEDAEAIVKSKCSGRVSTNCGAGF